MHMPIRAPLENGVAVVQPRSHTLM